MTQSQPAEGQADSLLRDDPERLPQATGASAVRSPELRGPAGRLEALYTPGTAGATHAAIVCHPHPLFGGTLHNKVVYHAAKVFQQAGLPVLRFNFRGAGASEGAHDRGDGEQDDLRAAMGWLRAETGLPLLVAGFSFGAYVSLRTCCEASSGPLAVRGLVALGLPIQAGDRGYTYAHLAHCTLPKLFISGSADAFGPVSQVTAAVSQAAQPWDLVWIPQADHFFARLGGGTCLPQMQAALAGWLQRSFPSFESPSSAHPTSTLMENASR